MFLLEAVEGNIEEFEKTAVAKRLRDSAIIFKRFGYIGFWSQLTLSVVSVVILLFSIAFENQVLIP